MSNFSSSFVISLILFCLASTANAAPSIGVTGRKEIVTAFNLISQGNVDPIDKEILARACAGPMRSKEQAITAEPVALTDAKALVKIYDALVASGSEERALARVCVEGMIAATNHKGTFIDFAEWTANTKTDSASTGLSLRMVDGTPKVAIVFRGGPAYSKLLAGDRIVLIDHKPTSGRSLTDVVALLRGPLGSTIEISAQRDSVGTVSITLTRAMVASEIAVSIREGIAIVTLPEISKGLPAKLTAAVNDAVAQVKRGYIIDLRSCPGGLFNEAIEIADLFIDQGVIAGQQGPLRTDRETWKARPGDIAQKLPIVVLISHDTGGGAEIIASALRERRGAKIVGQATAGVGTVQTLIPLSDRAAFTFTTARILQANGTTIDHVGVKPDVEIGNDGEDAIFDRVIATFPALN